MLCEPQIPLFNKLMELHGGELRRATVWSHAGTRVGIYQRVPRGTKGTRIAGMSLSTGTHVFLDEERYMQCFGTIPNVLMGHYEGTEQR